MRLGVSLHLTQRRPSGGGAAVPVVTNYIPKTSSGASLLMGAGAVQLVSDYTSNLLRVVRRSDLTSMQVPFLASGASAQQVDTTGIATFAAGGTLGVDLLYDQSGNGYNYTSTTDAERPFFSLSAISAFGDRYPINTGIATTGASQGATAGVQLFATGSTGYQVDRRNCTIFLVTSPGGGTFNSNGLACLGVDGGVATNNLNILYDTTSNKAAIQLQGFTFTDTSLTPGASQFNVIALQCSGTSIKIWKDGVLRNTLPAEAARTMSGGYIGRAASAASFMGPSQFFAKAVYNAALPDADVTTISQTLMALANVTAKTKTLAFDGDSLTCGLNESGYMRNLPRQLAPNIGADVFTPNFGIAGQFASQIYARRGSTFAQSPTSGMTKNVLHVWMGTNDIENGTTAATIWSSSILPYIQAAITAGRDVIVGTIIPRGWASSAAAKDVERLSLNTTIKSNAATYGYSVADYGGIAALSTGAANNPPNATYYGTGTSVHINPTGYGLCEAVLRPIAVAKL